jgi:oxygen-independent coproporphyrinogen-3 oxidase
MELPFNTVYSGQVLDGGGVQVADWDTKRAWHDYAFNELEGAGYEISSAYTMIKKGQAPFVYRDSVWHGCDLVGVGVSSFSHLGGLHFQNISNWDRYLEAVDEGRLPVERGFLTRPEERLTREMILQLKRGHLSAAYFRNKHSAEIVEQFGEAFGRLRERGMLTLDGDEIRLTREGLLRVDSLLPEFYAAQYQNARYT